MKLEKQLIECISIPGISTKEEAVAAYLLNRLKELNIQSEIDASGNVVGHIKSEKSNAKTILLEAHMDQIGLMVSGIDEHGYIKFINLGGVDERILCGMDVEILSSTPLYGVISSCHKPDTTDNQKINAKPEDLRIDIGFSKEISKSLVKIGDIILISGHYVNLLNSRISGGAMDNRAGISAILDCVQKLDFSQIPYNIDILFSTQEELGLHGAFTGTKNADAAIVIDVTHGTTPDSKDETGVFPLGSGAVICRGPNLHYEYTKQLIGIAKTESIPYEVEVASGPSGTTAWAIQIAEKGIPVMLVSIPLRYMHTNVETLEINDIKAVSDLIFSAVTGGIKID